MNFCPYCGTAQQEGIERGDAAAHAEPSAQGVQLEKPVQDGVPVAAAASTVAPRAEDRTAASPAAAPVPPPNTTPASTSTPAPTSRTEPKQPIPPGAKPAPGVRASASQPSQRKPVRLRWWLLALALLWVVWLVANPGKRRVEAQMDKAIGLATSCKPREAQNELIALRKTRATPDQLQHVQQVLNDAAADCTRKRQRDKAWREAKTAVESALAASSFDKARQRLRAFTKRWGDDDNARALHDRIEERSPEHPRADGR
ncbi:hypothetical protein [Massilia brevitalea]|uniref:hypothetical protein n=1 Tax=Massilia brevitalea TaxID=442526 RepID=UPI0027385424|nr:hypothetical protein [Massilia brevitalea]